MVRWWGWLSQTRPIPRSPDLTVIIRDDPLFAVVEPFIYNLLPNQRNTAILQIFHFWHYIKPPEKKINRPLIKGDAGRPTRPPKANHRDSTVTSTTKESAIWNLKSEIWNLQPEKATLSSRVTWRSWFLQLFSCVSEHTNSSSPILASVKYM